MTSKAENTEIIKELWDSKGLVIYEAIKTPMKGSNGNASIIYLPKELIGKKIKIEYDRDKK